MSAMNRKMIQNLAETLCKQVQHFSIAEVQGLIRLFNGLVGEQAERRAAHGLDRVQFRNILHNTFGLTEDVIMDRVFCVFDKDNDTYVSVKEWVEGLSVFLRGTLDEKIKFCFDVYDLNGDGYITREEMFQMLKDSLVRQPTEEDPDERIKDVVEIAWKKMDYDHDGRVSYSDFEKTVIDENLLLEAFGNCLPDTKALERQTQTETVHCEGNIYCPAEKFCCKTASGQWGCCSGMVLKVQPPVNLTIHPS